LGSRGSKEKDVVLAIAKRLQSQLGGLSEFRILMTRDSDFFVPLGVRVQKARKVQADLFISIHADAFVLPSAKVLLCLLYLNKELQVRLQGGWQIKKTLLT